MKTFIALLRGINVGGKNIINMADLKRVFESIGLYEVKTYIQSGNVLFKSDENENNKYEILGRDVYLLFSQSIRNSKLASNLQKLDVTVTVRNWKTIEKLTALAKAMDN